MRKLMIAMLALAVVFGFAACDNSTSTSGTGSQLDIAYIVGTEVNDKDYLVGDEADPADFKFTGYDAADNVVIESMSAELFKAKGTLSATDDEAVFTYNGMGLVASKEIKVPVDVYAIEKITVDASKVNKDYYTIVETGSNGAVSATTIGTDGAYEEYAKVDTIGLVVTATYDTDKTVELNEKQYTAKIGTVTAATGADWAEFGATEWGATALTTAVAATEKAVVQISVDGVAPVYYDVNFMLNKVTDVYFDVTDDYVVWYDDGKTSADAKLSSTDIKLYAKMLNGQDEKAVTGAKFSLVNAANATLEFSALKLNADVSSVVVYAKYTGTDVAADAPKELTAQTDPITVDENYKTGIKVTETQAVVLEIGKDYAAETVTAFDSGKGALKFEYVWADKKNTEATLILNAKENGFTINPAIFSADRYSARNDVPVTVTTTDGFSAQILVDLTNPTA